MLKNTPDRGSPVPGMRLRAIDSWNETIPNGTEGRITKVGKRPHGVKFYDVDWDNGIQSSVYDALIFHKCQILD